jgi:peptidoglycan-associated lipoprotein
MSRNLVTVALSALLLHCAADPVPPPAAPVQNEPPAALPPPAAAPAQKPGDNPNQSDIRISDEIQRACGITAAEAHFAYDSAQVRGADRAVLKKLADCFSTGPLKGRQMRLVGHADNRGDSEYNMVLGGERADNVKGAISREGLAADRMQTTSRGEMDSVGTDEASWSKDRRVDVLLGN